MSEDYTATYVWSLLTQVRELEKRVTDLERRIDE